MATPSCNTSLPAEDYDLAATLASGQVFRWRSRLGNWVSVAHGRWVKLQQRRGAIAATTALPQSDWRWLTEYLQIDSDFEGILSTFPDDAPMLAAVTACRGLRLLRQDPWECLVSFILSSTKQIVQIRQIITSLCARFGTPVTVPFGESPAFAFPTVERLAAATEAELRACKMGFRAPNLLATVRLIAAGKFDLEKIRALPLAIARAELMTLPGVGGKIADCVLLFAYGFPTAFPVDVWVTKALRQLYFPRRRVRPARLRHFVATHFGPNAGYAQQYLFHYMRTHRRKILST
jgi:N-glycosylase/DNA lyase